MRRMVEDDAELALEELQILSKLKKLAVMPNEEIAPPREVAENWEEWLLSVRSEVESLLNEKEAFREVFPEELQNLKKMQKRKERGSNISRLNWCSPENLALMAVKRKYGVWHAGISSPAEKKKTTSVVELMLQLFAS